METVFEAFGVESPTGKAQVTPVSRLCPLGQGATAERKKFRFTYPVVKRLLRNIAQQRNVWISGPSGCGKTELCVQVAVRLERPSFVISFGEETSLRDLYGSMAIVSKQQETGTPETGITGIAKAMWALARQGLGIQTEFRYGHLVQAIQTPGAIVVLDELNMAPAGIVAQMNRFLETGEIVIPETGETIKKAEGVAIIVCANTAGGTDETGNYAGSQTQNGATRSRFAYMEVGYLPAEQERLILIDNIPEVDNVRTATEQPFSVLAVQFANACRGLVNNGAVSLPFTVRHLLTFGKAAAELGDLEMAVRDAYFDGLAPSEQVACNEIVHKVFGIKLEISGMGSATVP
jgi:cobaltochelatase CobS